MYKVGVSFIAGCVLPQRLVAGFATRRPEFEPESSHVEFVVEK
jgi:hypothetical protein